MPDRGEDDLRCCRVASDRTLNEGLANLLPLADRVVAQSTGDCCMPKPSTWVRVRPENSSITVLRRPYSLPRAGSAETPRWTLRECHRAWWGGGMAPNLLNSCIFYAFSILSCDPLVSTPAAGQKRLQLCESTALLVVAADLAAHQLGGGQVARARVLRAQLFCDRGGRIALEVPPSDAKLPLNCRLLDGFVGTPPIHMSVNHYASFCGIRPMGASRFPDWAIAAVVLRVQK